MGKFPFPEILSHPNIPKPLHGVNPRTVLGREWWDIHRREAYTKYDYHCWACGYHKSEVPLRKNILEAHEAYDIDYMTGTVTLKEIVAVCHCCHSFIHSNRTWILYSEDELTADEAMFVYQRGHDILDEAKLQAFYTTEYYYRHLVLGCPHDIIIPQLYMEGYMTSEMPFASWEKWKLIIENQEHYSLFKNEQEHNEYYSML